MSSQFSFSAHDEKLTSELPCLSVSVGFNDLTSVYQSQLLADRIEYDLAKFFQAKGIKVRRYKSPMAGGGGDILDWFINFYHAHQMAFALFIKIPALVQAIKTIIAHGVNWYYRQSILKKSYLPTITIGFHWLLHDNNNEYTNLEMLKRSMTETYNLIPHTQMFLERKHAEIEFTYSITSKIYGKGTAISINNYHFEQKTMGRILRKINKLTSEHSTYLFYICRQPLLKYKTYKLTKNAVIF